MKAIFAVPAIAALVYRAYSKKSLTPSGIVAAILTAIVHAVHPWNLPFVLLVVFFLAGTRVTNIKKEVKAKLTVHSAGASGGEGPRTHNQVFANSLVASALTLMHAYLLRNPPPSRVTASQRCAPTAADLLVVGIIANYAAVAADTFSSELGILSRSRPRLITSPTLREVPPGTNGGVTPLGLGAGVLGSMVLATTAMIFLPLCGQGAGMADAAATGRLQSGWTKQQGATLLLGLTVWGALGSVVDSFLGGWLQRSVRDVRTNKIVEGEGGVRVLISGEEGAGRVTATSPLKAVVQKASIKVGVKDAAEKQEAVAAAAAAGNTSAIAADDEDEDAETVAKRRYDARDKHRVSSFGNAQPTRVIESGLDLLDNNDVNFLMAASMSIGAMAVAKWYFDVPLAIA